MVNNILTFGGFNEKSFEWAFFNAPWYVQWLRQNQVLQDRLGYDDEDRAYFNELYRRADALNGTCAKCHERPLTRIDIGDLIGANGNGTVGLHCTECYVQPAELHLSIRPSFFSVDKRVPRCAQKTITRAVRNHFIGPGNLTQAKMEQFFRDDAHFKYAKPGYFADYGKEVKQ